MRCWSLVGGYIDGPPSPLASVVGHEPAGAGELARRHLDEVDADLLGPRTEAVDGELGDLRRERAALLHALAPQGEHRDERHRPPPSLGPGCGLRLSGSVCRAPG